DLNDMSFTTCPSQHPYRPRRSLMTATIDDPRPVRPGEELDLERLAPYLRRVLGAPSDADVGVQQFPGGHSNLTYLVTVGADAYVLRRPPFGSQVKTAHDMEREHALLSR